MGNGSLRESIFDRLRQRYINSSVWLGFGQVIRLGVSLVLSILIARHLGPKDFGTLNYAMAIVAIVSTLAGLGLENVMKRLLLDHPEKKEQLLGSFFFITSVSSSLFAFILVMFAYVGGMEDSRALIVTILGAELLSKPFYGIEFWFSVQLRARTIFTITAISVIVSAFLKLLCIVSGAGIEWLALAIVAEPILVAALRILSYQKAYGPLFIWRYESGSIYRLLRRNWPMLLSAFAITLYMKVDQIMLKNMLNEVAVGNYAAATRITSIFYFIPTVLAGALLPAIHKARTQESATYRLRLQQYFDLNAALAYMIAIPIAILSPWIIGFAYGDRYDTASGILVIHGWNCLFAFLGVSRSQALITEGFFVFSMCATLLGAISNIVLNWIFIPIYEANGAATASLISFGLSAFASSFFWKPTRQFGWLQMKALLIPTRPMNLLSSLKTL